MLLAFLFGFAIGERRQTVQTQTENRMRDYAGLLEKRENSISELQIAIDEIVRKMDRSALEKD